MVVGVASGAVLRGPPLFFTVLVAVCGGVAFCTGHLGAWLPHRRSCSLDPEAEGMVPAFREQATLVLWRTSTIVPWLDLLCVQRRPALWAGCVLFLGLSDLRSPVQYTISFTSIARG